MELLYIAQQLGMPIQEVAVNWQEIEGGCGHHVTSHMTRHVLCPAGSKMVPIFSWMEMGRDLIFIRARYTFRIWSIHTKQKLK